MSDTAPEPFDDACVARHAEMLGNRVRKRFRHFHRRFERRNIGSIKIAVAVHIEGGQIQQSQRFGRSITYANQNILTIGGRVSAVARQIGFSQSQVICIDDAIFVHISSFRNRNHQRYLSDFQLRYLSRINRIR